MIRRLAGLALAVAGLAGCAQGGPAPAGFSQSGVRVEAVLEAGQLVVTLTPDPGFHVYSIDLPADGIDGLGRPTVVRPLVGLEATGALRADRPVVAERPAGLEVTLPVYPEGPVTIRLPVRSVTGADPEIAVSYAACSDRTCLAPVSGRRIRLARTES